MKKKEEENPVKLEVLKKGDKLVFVYPPSWSVVTRSHLLKQVALINKSKSKIIVATGTLEVYILKKGAKIEAKEKGEQDE